MTASLNDAVLKLLDEINPAVLGTINPDGSPQTSVVWVARDGADLGQPWVFVDSIICLNTVET